MGLTAVEQVKGVEPSYQAWEACVLPMNYTCVESSLSIARPGKKMQEKSFGLFCAAGPKEHLAARRNRMEYQAPETLGLRQRWPRVFCLPYL